MSADTYREHLLHEAAAELQDERVQLRATAATLAAEKRAFSQDQRLEGGIVGDCADIATDVADQERADRLMVETNARLLSGWP
jgi:hypothetical protein